MRFQREAMVKKPENPSKSRVVQTYSIDEVFWDDKMGSCFCDTMSERRTAKVTGTGALWRTVGSAVGGWFNGMFCIWEKSTIAS